MKRFVHYLMMLLVLVVGQSTFGAAAQKPIARFVVLSNTYIATQPAESLVDDQGANRGWLTKISQPCVAKSVELINRLSPDAVVILGSLTWAGSDADFAAFDKSIADIKAPVLLTPGMLDTPGDSMANYKKHFPKHDVSNSSQIIAGVRLMFAGDMGNPDTIAQATERLQKQAATNDKVQATLLFGGRTSFRGEGTFDTDDAAFWNFVEKSQVGVRFEPTRYGSHLSLTNTLPLYKVGSTAWSLRGAVTLVTVYKNKIVIEKIRDLDQPAFAAVVPNPVNADRLVKAEADPYLSPSYSLDLKDKPDLTFAVVSDPQLSLDDRSDKLRKKAEACIEDINRLKPAHVFITGDLVERNLPQEWALSNDLLAKIKIPFTLMPGNHDVLFLENFEEKQYSSISEKEPKNAALVKAASEAAAKEGYTGAMALYHKYTGLKGPQVVKIGDCVFICLEVLTQRIEADQLAWLRDQLEATRDAKHVFVMGHYPILDYFGNNVLGDKGGSEALKLFKEYKVAGYIFGHRHRSGFRMYDDTAHILVDNMKSTVLVHVFDDHLVIARKDPDSPLYEKLEVPEPRFTPQK